jgi:uncharacterized membrane protein
MRPNGAIIGILGVWLMIAGIIGISRAAYIWNDWIVGIIVAVLGFSMAGSARAQGIVAGILGLWMIASAFIPSLNSGPGTRWDDVLVGVILAIAGFTARRRLAESTGDFRRAA